MKKQLVLLVTLLTAILHASAEEPKWIELFNGKDLTGWIKTPGTNEYRAEDGTIIGKTIEGSPSTYLCTEKEYSNFILEYEFKVNPALNAGVQFRSVRDPKKNNVHGYQAEIDMDPAKNRWWALGLFDQSGGRKWLFPGLLGGNIDEFSAQGRRLSKQNDWNQAKVICQGEHIQMWLNGELRVDVNDSGPHDANPLKGFIALQIHHVPSKGLKWVEMECAWRNIRVQELP